LRESCRLTAGGKALGGANVLFSVRIGTLTPVVAEASADEQGRFPLSGIDSDSDYEVTVLHADAGEGGVMHGVLRIGDRASIDVRTDLRPLPVDGR
jgi:hypothetical protein